MTESNTDMLVVPAQLTQEQATEIMEICGYFTDPSQSDAVLLSRGLRRIGMPIRSCNDVETACWMDPLDFPLQEKEDAPTFYTEVAGRSEDVCTEPLVRRSEMERQVAACKADIVRASYDYHTADIGSPDGPPCARFDQMFDEGDTAEVQQRVLRYLGIEIRIVVDDWEDSAEGFSLDRKTVEALPVPDFVPGGQWKLASACDTEDGTILREYVRPLAAPASEGPRI
ncbi:hypothetical protein MSKU15_1039 [Komagataeibacter diospyri]|uniref:hypothetical protein n=1 Tax=Komagataeibacter diospyri TaxID=1932662 RepID=UPI00113BB1EB|nr:hypothetical protein [Komagataeibacter diospyri]GCE89438.1 hypothetical protein MSKU15_1039 [Komagataeibacter diospyri]